MKYYLPDPQKYNKAIVFIRQFKTKLIKMFKINKAWT